MTAVKTAISIDQLLFDQVSRLADELDVSRSRLFVMAVEEFIHRFESRELLRQINEAYADQPLAEEKQIQRARKRLHREMAEGEW